MVVPADKSKWSEASKNSFSYDSCIEYYEDIPYHCYKCDAKAVFTAEEQKEAFEILKCYVWQRRVLCSECYTTLKSLEMKVTSFETQWKEETESSKPSASYIQEWLDLLTLLPSYGKRKNKAMIAHLSKYKV